MRSPPRSRISLQELSLFWGISHVSPELLSHATGLKFQYVGVRPSFSKLAIVIGHSWSRARFMAAQIWAIDFAKIQSYLQCVSKVL